MYDAPERMAIGVRQCEGEQKKILISEDGDFTIQNCLASKIFGISNYIV
jgi:hypothetical protein